MHNPECVKICNDMGLLGSSGREAEDVPDAARLRLPAAVANRRHAVLGHMTFVTGELNVGGQIGNGMPLNAAQRGLMLCVTGLLNGGCLSRVRSGIPSRSAARGRRVPGAQVDCGADGGRTGTQRLRQRAGAQRAVQPAEGRHAVIRAGRGATSVALAAGRAAC
ncbi:hypothetical protein [Mangrovicoccus sp. HB161399]|uniref:hypothetical protein n=1 Tax=Mangrovicoccus sp. HB161399 TaxID=2720392 RepID=UPI0015525BB7|nr:hypothetical protein [Mangrovicoccus sp. HB161399]